MVKRSSQTLLAWFLVWDVVVTAAAWVAAYFLRFDTGIPLVNHHQPDFDLCVGNLPLVGIQTVAYADDHPDKHAHTDRPVVGPIADLPRLVHELHIEHVFIALPLNRYADARRVFDSLSQTIVDVRLVADVPALSALALTT